MMDDDVMIDLPLLENWAVHVKTSLEKRRLNKNVAINVVQRNMK